MSERTSGRKMPSSRWIAVPVVSLMIGVGATEVAAQARQEAPPPEPAWEWDPSDPRIGLDAGHLDAEEAISNLEMLATLFKPEAFVGDEAGGRGFTNTDIAFQGDNVFLGNYYGFQIYDVTNPSEPRLRVAVVCPGGQGDVSVYRNLLFMSVEQTSGRLDCGTEGVQDSVSTERFRGVRIFDISDIDTPRQIKTLQTCRGSHTHTLVTKPGVEDRVWIYVSGTGRVRSPSELAGCSGLDPDEDPNTSLFRIEVIEVPMARPGDAEIVNMPRIFASEDGDIAGLWEGGDHGEGTQNTRTTNQCHDITAYPELSLAAGACSGNGILLDISDPANPVRIDQVSDPNFAYWHSATFNNDGTAVIFTDEWGGGGAPRCRGTDPKEWGANALFRLENRRLELAGYYKLPVPQTNAENCVAHNGSLIPVPGRDIKVQAWYQGGVSVFDFTDPANPFEIAYFDRGPLDAVEMLMGGYWSTYWHNGHIYGAEIARGIDVFRLSPSEHLSQAEIDAAMSVRMPEFNAQHQPKIEWPASFAVVRSYLVQLQRGDNIDGGTASAVGDLLDRAEQQPAGAGRNETMAELVEMASALDREASASGDPRRMGLLADSIRKLADALR